MGNFIDLLRNENMKIYSRPRTWIMLGIMLVIMLASDIIAVSVGADTKSMWEAFMLQSILGFNAVVIYSVVIAADSVAGEFSAGTIKLLMIRPWSRSKILLSKYIAIIGFALFFFAALFVWNYLLDGIFFGFSSGTVQEMIGEDSTKNIWNYMLSVYGLQLLATTMMTITLSFLLSTVFRSGGLSIGLSLLLMFMSGTLSGVLSMLDKPWVDYFWFMNENLTQYLLPGDYDHTLGFSLGVLAVYYLVFIAVTWTVFNKRDIAS
ncbi:ABC transporter permease [Paenibacillus kobensis]|uniref:ABC transporter permease n=1 Tax=Paenibacillus kobensis TaxID=59841 RepID=UPI000FD92E0D